MDYTDNVLAGAVQKLVKSAPEKTEFYLNKRSFP